MIKSLTWMFKTKEFYKHYILLLVCFFMCAMTAFLSYFAAERFAYDNIFLSLSLYAVMFISIIFPFLASQGYFWQLTSGIISRDFDVKANNVYDGKVKERFSPQFPEVFRFRKFVWRGFASLVAISLMLALYVFFIQSNAFQASFTGVIAIAIMIFFAFFIPALLWNYAKQDSIFAVLNIRKAKYIMGTYFFAYIYKTFLMIFFTAINLGLVYLIVKLLLATGMEVFSMSLFDIMLITIGILVCIIKYLYDIFVFAYLLGTIAPTSEG